MSSARRDLHRIVLTIWPRASRHRAERRPRRPGGWPGSRARGWLRPRGGGVEGQHGRLRTTGRGGTRLRRLRASAANCAEGSVSPVELTRRRQTVRAATPRRGLARLCRASVRGLCACACTVASSGLTSLGIGATTAASGVNSTAPALARLRQTSLSSLRAAASTKAADARAASRRTRRLSSGWSTISRRLPGR